MDNITVLNALTTIIYNTWKTNISWQKHSWKLTKRKRRSIIQLLTYDVNYEQQNRTSILKLPGRKTAYVICWRYDYRTANNRKGPLCATWCDMIYLLIKNKYIQRHTQRIRTSGATRLKNSTNSRPWKLNHNAKTTTVCEIKKITQINTINWALKSREWLVYFYAYVYFSKAFYILLS